MRSLYDQLPVELLSNFYHEIKMNIVKGILTEAMYSELELIEKAAAKKGINVEKLHKNSQND